VNGHSAELVGASPGIAPNSAVDGLGPLSRHRVVAVLSVGLIALAFIVLSPGRAVIAALAAPALVLLAAIDIEQGIIPNRIVLPASVVVLIAHVALFPGHALEWLSAALLAALALLIPRVIRPAWMGMGDVKLALLMGGALGAEVVGAMLIGFVSVFPVAIVMLIRGGGAARKSTIPFGPFLAFGALVALYVPQLAGG
jgi:leader peptidase (prepilin peptidase) / N-methyltransferase